MHAEFVVVKSAAIRVKIRLGPDLWTNVLTTGRRLCMPFWKSSLLMHFNFIDAALEFFFVFICLKETSLLGSCLTKMCSF
jgi:hypothetical protein